MAQLAQRLCFDLPHPLPGHVELLAQFFQGAGAAILQTKAQGDDPLLPGRQAFKDVQQFPPQQLAPGFVHRDTGVLVLNKVLQMSVLFLPHRRFQTDGFLRQLQQFPHLVRLHIQCGGDLLHGGLPPIFVQQIARRFLDPVDALHQMHRDTDGASLIRNGAGDGLTDPPGCVGGELEAPLRLKLFSSLHQAEVALLNEIQKRQSTPGVALGYRYHQPQVCFAQGAAGLCIPGPGSLCQRHLLSGGQQRHPADLL